MKENQKEKEKKALDSFLRKKVLRVEQVAELLACSIPTARRRLKKWQSYTSYNQNGRFYTLPDIAEFDQNGLWQHKGIFFSKHGNLLRTVVNLIHISGAGLTASEIGEKVGSSPRSFLTKIGSIPNWRREKLEGKFIYFSGDLERLNEQKKNREKIISSRRSQQLSDRDSIIILAEKIKHPEASIDKLARIVKKKVKSINADLIRNLFEDQGLLKKTPDFQ